MEKPVIILGGGIIGSLLAYRLKEVLPYVPFKLYEGTSHLGDHQSFSFKEADCLENMNWLRPFISHSWSAYEIKLKKLARSFHHSYHLIDSRQVHDVISKKLAKEDLRLNNKIPLELALQESSFVIDTRNECYYKKTGYRKHLTLELELLNEHGLTSPVIMDENVEKKECSRCWSYFPLSSKKILIKDFWFSNNRKLELNEMQNALCESIKEKGWKISRILREESGVSEMPVVPPLINQEGRLINLAGLFHDTTGLSISSMSKVIEQMVHTSFRFGELKEVVTVYRKKEEKDLKTYRSLNRKLIEGKHGYEFESINKLSIIDRSRFIVKALLPPIAHSQHRKMIPR